MAASCVDDTLDHALELAREASVFRSALEPSPPSSEWELEIESNWKRCEFATPLELCRLGAMLHPHCESPIEKMYGVAILARYPEIEFCAGDVKRPRKRFALVPQYRWRNYRIDWALCAPRRALPVVFIECDGARFHATPEQIERDREKDAAVVASGITMLRFTGRQIYGSAAGCADLTIEAVHLHLRGPM